MSTPNPGSMTSFNVSVFLGKQFSYEIKCVGGIFRPWQNAMFHKTRTRGRPDVQTPTFLSAVTELAVFLLLSGRNQ